MSVMERLRSLDRKVSRHSPAARMVAPPVWGPQAGRLTPVVLNPRQRGAVWAAYAVAAIGGAIDVVPRFDLVELIFPAITVASMVIAAGSSRAGRRAPRSALRWLEPGTPVAATRLWSGWLATALAIDALVAAEIVVNAPIGLLGFTVGFTAFALTSEWRLAEMWGAVEAAHSGRVVRTRHPRRDTSGLYFLPVPVPSAQHTLATTGPRDRSNAYRAPSS